MSQRLNYSEFGTWSELFHALCTEQNHLDNAQLARGFCSLINSSGESAYESALRNFDNWRKGQHVPSRKNFEILSKLLNIEAQENLKSRWDALYREAKDTNGHNGDAENAPNNSFLGNMLLALGHRPMMVLGVISAIGLLTLGVGLGYTSGFFRGVALIGKSGAVGPETNRHEFYVKLKVGNSAIISGARSNCGEAPPPWDRVGPGLMKLKIGTLSDGGIGKRYSISCKGMVPTRAIKFTATHKGREEFMLYSDRTIIDVQ